MSFFDDKETGKCTTCGKQDNKLQKIDTGHGYTEVLCSECRESSVEMAEKLDRVKDLKNVEGALDELIELYDIQNKQSLPQRELASYFGSVIDALFELRDEVKKRKQEVRKPIEGGTE